MTVLADSARIYPVNVRTCFQLLVSWSVHSVWRNPITAVIRAAWKHKPHTTLSQRPILWMEQRRG